MRKISQSTVRRLSLYLRFLEQFAANGQTTISSEELARRGGTTSAQVRKDLSFFGSFGKRGLGYSVPELAGRLREILGLGRKWRSEEHTSEPQSPVHLVCRLLLEKKKLLTP